MPPLGAGLRQALERHSGQSIVAVSPVTGGDINEALRVQLADGRVLFVKTHASASPLMFPAEASGLSWLAGPGVLRVPKVIAVSTSADTCHFLALEYIQPGAPRADYAARFGQALAELHRAGAPCFGLSQDNFIGSLPQSNRTHSTWSEFYREERLKPQVRMAVSAGALSSGVERLFERLYERLDELVGPSEPPARLHGDLWGGNAMADERGEPCVFDPAVYGGHREMDLAMMRLFGGFAPRTFEAYDEAYPLAPGHHERIKLYQLYPLLVHVNLFGGGYARAVETSIRHYL